MHANFSLDSPRILCSALVLLTVVTITFAKRNSVETVVAAIALVVQQLLPNIPEAVVPNQVKRYLEDRAILCLAPDTEVKCLSLASLGFVNCLIILPRSGSEDRRYFCN